MQTSLGFFKRYCDKLNKAGTSPAFKGSEANKVLPYNQVKQYYFTYNLDTRVCRREDDLAVRYGSRKIYENMPYSFADDVVLEEDHENYLGTYKRLHEGERFVSCDYRIKGTEIWSRVSLYRVNMDSPLVEGIVQDVSDHYNDIIAQAEENEREKRRMELETIQLLNGIKDAYDMVFSANLTQNTYRMISYENYLYQSTKNAETFDELVEIGIRNVLPPYKDRYKKAFSREALLNSYHEGKRDVYYEHQQYDDKGVAHWVATHVIFTDNPMNNDILVIAMIQNIDERIKKEKESEIALQDALNTAKMANAAKSDFLSSMSHDIRTPMNTIIGMTTLAVQHLDDREYMKNCLHKMSLASNHLLTLINDILDISKVESGKMTLKPVVFSLADMISNLTNIVKHQVSGKNQKFDVRVHNITREFLFADELRLNQVFINLLSNAVKYTPESGCISMDLAEDYDPAVPDKVRLTYVIRDTGIGMSEEFQQTMFESFSRASSTKYGEIQGSGLGLTISKRLVDLMHGTISCKSRLGEGTAFTVSLELPVADKDTSDLVLPPMDVLLIDEDKDFLQSATQTLGQMGITPDCEANDWEAVCKIYHRHQQGSDYSVIIVGWKMTETSGAETVRRIRSIVGSNTIILVAGACDWQDIKTQAREAGANGFIGKPFFASKVYEGFAEVLDIQTAVKTEKEADTEQPNIEGMNVLIAEDNTLNMEIAMEVLKVHGIRTVGAENGQICIDILKASQDGEFDLVLMDVRMPVMDGYEATKMIRKEKRDYVRNIPIIAMTADAFAEDIQQCLEAGMNGHIAKPLSVPNLMAVMDESFHGNK